MGLSGINIGSLLLILLIVLLLFGTKKLRGMGGDLGGAIKGFKDAMAKDEDESSDESQPDEAGALNENAQSSENTESAKEENKEPHA